LGTRAGARFGDAAAESRYVKERERSYEFVERFLVVTGIDGCAVGRVEVEVAVHVRPRLMSTLEEERREADIATRRQEYSKRRPR
jgi:hypothetical protein